MTVSLVASASECLNAVGSMDEWADQLISLGLVPRRSVDPPSNEVPCSHAALLTAAEVEPTTPNRMAADATNCVITFFIIWVELLLKCTSPSLLQTIVPDDFSKTNLDNTRSFS